MTLRFRLLGEPQLWYGDARLDKLLSRKQLALLIYLVCDSRAIRRERLATLLWGECSQRYAAYNLRRALCGIGKLMASFCLDRATFLDIDLDEIQFRWDAPHSLDILDFMSAVQMEDLERATELYGPFLGTFTVNKALEFEDWQRQQRAIFDVALERFKGATMTATKEDVMLVKLALGALAAEKGEKFATSFYTRTLKSVACTEVRRMSKRLESIQGIGPDSSFQLLAQLGWFVSQTIDNAIPPVVY